MWIIFPLLFLAGFVDSIAGGGGLISVTAYYAAGLPAHLALGTNKFSSFLGTGISAARFAKHGYVHWPTATLSFFGALAGSTAGARLALLLNERVLTVFMLVFVPAVALVMILKRDFGVSHKELSRVQTVVYSLLIGIGIGAYDGFFGPGTGTFLIMAYTAIMGFSLMTACGNTKIVNFASNVAAVVTFMAHGDVDFRLGIPSAACCILGHYLGAGLAMKKGARIVRPMMLVVIAMLLIKILWDFFTS